MERRDFLKYAGVAAALAAAPPGLLLRLPGRADAAGKAPKVLCLGFDGMDPLLLREYLDAGGMPNFARAIATGRFRPCGTSTPPQSPVAWSNFITGTDPGGHGICDFIHRDPATLTPHLSIAEAKAASRFIKVGGWKLPRSSGSVTLLRRGRAFWEDLSAAGIDVTIFKMPSNYPPVDCGARSISGMGTPDILGTYGIYTLFTQQENPPRDTGGGRVVKIDPGARRFTGELLGPPNTWRDGDPDTGCPVDVVIDAQHGAVKITCCDDEFVLKQGEWSDWVRVRFPLVAHLKDVTGICRFRLIEGGPRMRLYVTPVQIDPEDPVMPICAPESYSRELATATGPYFTQGLPDDTKALDEGVFSDADYVSQSDLVLAERHAQFHYELDRFRGLDGGFLFFYFNSLDQNSHMFWRAADPLSPTHEPGGAFAGRIRDIYHDMDRVLGEALDAVGDEAHVFVVSDHGFSPYRRSFHLNRWLLDNGFLALRPGASPESVSYLSGVDWRRTRAYGLGINSLYLNLAGRERRGVVAGGAEREDLLRELVAGLESVTDPVVGGQVVRRARRTDEAYHGPCTGDCCDIVVGCERGWRISNESALGGVPPTVLSDNPLKWSGDHCQEAAAVPGVLVCNRPFACDQPTLLDMAPTFLRLYGLDPSPQMLGSDIFAPGA